MSFSGNISYGATGDTVKKIQEALNKTGKYNLAVDGIWGKDTDSAIRDYQQNNGLDVDGIVGEKTWSSLFGGGESATGSSDYKPPSFDSTHYNDTDAGKAALDAKTNAEAAVASYGDFAYSNKEELDAIMQSILGRKPFTYDFNADALYHQYADQYMQKGKMAMQDTMGQAAAMTGGYGNSYAATAGNQAYQAYLGELNNIIPDLYQMAYDRYNQEGQDMYNQYSLLSEDYAREYGAYTDEYGRLVDDRTYATDSYYAGQDAYVTERDTANALAQKDFENTLALSAEERAERELAMKEEAWDFESAELQAAADEKTYSGKGSNENVGNFDNQGYSNAEVKRAQAFVGASQDGLWGANSEAAAKAAGYNSLEEVMDALDGDGDDGFTGSTYDDAISYMESKGVKGASVAGLMTSSEWNRRKSSHQAFGTGAKEVKDFATYTDYLKRYVEFALDPEEN